MIKKIRWLEKRINTLEKDISRKSMHNYYDLSLLDFFNDSEESKEGTTIWGDIKKLKGLIDMLLEKSGLEYVKITEENGGKEVREVLRKKKSKKK